ncbi:nicotinate-nucleotide--dimethylbenzimidazole phosphoribosyltransferase [Pseudoalteromonas sp. MMG013]|uniref:nicotinate-nucleotide--dimethylbenzimidazole phosphoribosyltransferase n=1 Tax=Pseudoalteromonas sp. MMG013 TaxID=2822687 RepID=UPI001B383BD8|nr:nicotinate-nucleotide--dimethylbenzimidazole phosphoribosyltransferase [Pseudoalteromonas sp. MMG013]MBQ4861151.1 nicotinate-nucleotide--dimethylbenzimidazole phosphoribosyltransferase [Pseudoalteromonas sp. MMG013]
MVKPLDNKFSAQIKQKIDLKTKPLGALGQLECVAFQLVSIFSQHTSDTEFLSKKWVVIAPQLIVFAGDHGIASQGVSIAPSEVTGQMMANFAAGGAAINVLCRQFGWQLSVVDCGILNVPEADLGVISQRLGNITQAFHEYEAMSEAQLEQGLNLGARILTLQSQKGANVYAFGEMGIGNTSSAAAIFSALSGLSPEETVGKGTGVSGEVVIKKQQLVAQALVLHESKLTNARNILRCLGGFEICQMVGAMQQAARLQAVIVVDGFIATAAAMIVIALSPNAQQYMIFAHCSGEQAHAKMLEYLNVKPLLNLGLRLGEGSGAALTLPIMQSALALYNDMASFEDAQVTQVVQGE